MKPFLKNPTNNGTHDTTLYNPWDRHLRNDLLDFWEGDAVADTIPSINIAEEKDRYKVDMAVPGLEKEDLNISVDGKIVTISCDKETETMEEASRRGGHGYSRKEFNYLDFSRSFAVPDNADTDHITAKYINGILSLDIPKKPEREKNKNQKITVE